MKTTEPYHTIKDYIKAKTKWLNTPAVITPSGEMFVLVKGKRYTEQEFDNMNPKPHYEPAGGDNLNGDKDGTLYGVKNKKK